ncbi:TPA: hypothetical protein QFT42_002401 [Enterococcus faecium]|nr:MULTISPECIES: hypothetical protein [Enterococcus]ELB58046.1 hypothetical protein OKQ_05425 [Enterococcus faecium EnGen0052]
MVEKDIQNDEKDTRVGNWSWIVYPESAPENWKQLLEVRQSF